MAEAAKTVRIPPRLPLVPLSALAWLVRIPGDPAAVRAFTAAEVDEARRYADERGGTCEPLQ